ncbi:MAG: O-antigen ligase family protein [Pseudomonadota bacterium]
MSTALQGRYLFAALVFVLLWAPLPIGSNRFWALWLLIGTVFLLAACCCLQLARGRLTVTPALRKSLWPLALLVLVQIWVLIQLLPGPLQTRDVWATTNSLFEGLAYTTVFALTLLLVDSRDRIRTLCFALVLSGAFQAAYGSFMTLSGLEYGFFYKKDAYVGLATGTFFARPHLAGYLVLCLAAGVGLLLADMEKHPAQNWREFQRRVVNTMLGPKLRMRLLLAVMVIGLVLTRSRMGNAAFFTGLISMGFLALLLQRRVTRNALLLFGSLLLIDALILGNWFGFEKVVERIEQTSTASETRDDVSADAYRIFKDHWVAGTGAGSFYSQFPAYRSTDAGPGKWYHAHNDLIELPSEYGVVGYTPMVLFVLTSAWAAITVQRRGKSRLQKAMGLTGSMAIVWLVMSSSVDFNMHIPATAVTFMAVMGIVWASLYMKQTRAAKVDRNSK